MATVTKNGYGIGFYAPAGFVTNPAALERAVARLSALGHRVIVDATCATRWERFSAPDDERLAAIGRMADDPRIEIAIAARGGYGWSRLLDRIDFRGIAEKGKRWLGHSDFTAFQLAALAHAGMTTFAGPMATDFGAAMPSAFTLDHCWGLFGNDHHDVECALDGPDFTGGVARRVETALDEAHVPVVIDGDDGRAARAVGRADDERRRQHPLPLERDAGCRKRVVGGALGIPQQCEERHGIVGRGGGAAPACERGLGAPDLRPRRIEQVVRHAIDTRRQRRR